MTLNDPISLGPFILAAIAPPADDRSMAVWWLLGLAAAALIFNQVADAWGKLTGRFSRDASPEGGFRSRKDCIEIHQQLNQNREKVQDSLMNADTELRKEIREDITGVHKRLDAVLTALVEIRKGKAES